MDLTNFKVLSKEQYDALTAKDQAKYELQLEAYEAQERKKEIDSVVEASIASKLEQASKDAEEKIEAAVKVVKDEYDVKVEKALADMNRAKATHNEMRGIKTIQDEIMEKLSTEEGESMLKSFLGGQREKLNLDVQSKAVLKPTGANGSGVAPQFTGIVGPGHDSFHARDAIRVFPTNSDLIKYVQMTVDPDATGFTTVAEGAQKPDLGYIANVVDAPVRKIAGLLDVSDEMMDDVVGIRAFWASELPEAYLDAEDAQIFKGNGTGQNLLGLHTQAALQTLPLGSVTSASNTWDLIAAGITEIRKKPIKRNASAVYISPDDYLNLLINKAIGGSEEYDYPMSMQQTADGLLRLGGVPIMWSNIFDAGEGVVGDFARGTAIFQRQAMNIRYFEENKDNAEKNIVTIRLEGRIALPIYYPDAFKKLALTGGAEGAQSRVATTSTKK